MVTKETVKNSLEARWLMKIIVSTGVCYLLCFIPFFIYRTEVKPQMILFFGIFVSVLFLPVIGYHIYCYVNLFRYIERYEIYELELNHPKRARFYRGARHYTASFQTRKGRNVEKLTRPLWRDEFLAKVRPLKEKSIHAKIAYNDVRDAILVLESDER